MIIEVDWPIDFSAVKWINTPGKRSKRRKEVNSVHTGEHAGWKRWLTSRAPTCNQGSWFSWWVIVSISANSNTVTFFFFHSRSVSIFVSLSCLLPVASHCRNFIAHRKSNSDVRQSPVRCRGAGEIRWKKSQRYFSSFLHLISPRFCLGFFPSSAVQLRIGQQTRYDFMQSRFFHQRRMPQLPRNIARVTRNLHNATSTLHRCAGTLSLCASYRFISRIIGLSESAH